MLFRKHIVSTRTLSQLAVAVVLSVAGVGTAMAANSGNAPLLVPYTQVTAAGDAQFHGSTASTPSGGYTGEGLSAISYIYCSATITTNCVYTSTVSQQGQTVTGGEMSAPHMVAVDSVGNLYITDTNNALIREVSAQTGILNTIAGVPPSNPNGKAVTGCSDGAPAFGSRLGSGLSGIAVDGYGNVYFTDSAQMMAAVIYRGGAQVAAFIQAVNPGAVKAAGGVLPGYIYHIAGTINVGNPANTGATCAATATYNGVVSDNAPSFENPAAPPSVQGATLNKPGMISLDSAGNIYIADVGDATVRVINTQATPQTFYQYTVAPGYMRSITECNGNETTQGTQVTIQCPGISTNLQGTGINGPVNEVPSTNQWVGAYTDAYGNTFQFNGTGSGTTPPGIFVGVAYAGGAPITNLLDAEAPFLTSAYGPNGVITGQNAAPAELPLIYGCWYVTIDNPAASTVTLLSNVPIAYGINNIDVSVRATAISEDTFGTVYWNDGHYPTVSRMDQYSSTVTMLSSGDTANAGTHFRAATSVAGVYSTYATFTNPWYCVYGSSGAANNFGPVQITNPVWPITYDPAGDGCPSIVAFQDTLKYGQVSDGQGNLFIMDSGWSLLKEFRVGNDFPGTALASATPNNPITQPIQVHFDAGNPPAGVSATTIPDGGAVGYTTTAFSITPSTDFTINTTTPEWPMGSLITGEMRGEYNTPLSNSGNFQLWPPVTNPTNIVGLPTCTQLGISLVPADTGYDCLVYVTFNPAGVGLRQAQLVAHTANGGNYTFQLTGIGDGPQIAIDGGQGNALTVNSSVVLGPVPQVAVNSAGTVYIADPTNNRVVAQPTSAFGVPNGNATTVGTGLSGPMGVAVDAASNVYISDTGNNRVVKVTPGGAQSVLGNYVWIAGATCYPATGSPAGDCTLPTNVPSVAVLGPDPTPGAITGTTAPPQYQFKAPQGLAVDTKGNVFVADTGNAAVVEIPANIGLGGAIPLLVGTGVAGFVSPVAVAVDSQNNIYVADTGNPAGEVVRIPPGGGDLQPGNVVGLGALTSLPLFGGQGITTPNGVAADAAGNVYISDSSTNLVWVAPAAGRPNGAPYTLNLSGLNSPGGIALDPSGNLYIADTRNHRIVGVNRINPTVSFLTVPQDLTPASGVAGTPVGCPVAGSSQPCTGVLTVTNIGNQPLTLASNFLTASGTATSGFNPNSTTTQANVPQTCSTLYTNPAVLPAGDSCTISPTFNPQSSSGASETLTVNGTQSVALTANGGNPEAVLTLTSSVGLTPAVGSTAVITATATQPHSPPGGTPAGTVTFTYAIDAGTANANGVCGVDNATGTTVNLVGGVATYTLPTTMAQGLAYTVNAVYTPATNDLDGLTNATPIVLTVPGIALTSVTANSVAFTYGQPVPAITGSITPPLPAGVTATFNPGGASQFSPVGSYNIGVTFSGTNACGYGLPSVTNTGLGGGIAQVTENQAALTVTVPDYTTVYGAASFNYASQMKITGAVGNDLSKLSATFTKGPPTVPPVAMDSSVLNVGVYQVYPTVTGKPVANYKITIAPSPLKSWLGGSDTVTPAAAGIAVTPQVPGGSSTTVAATVCNGNFNATATCVTPATVNKENFSLVVGTLVTAGKGIPSGTVSVTDNFIAITPTFFDTSTSLQPLPPASGMPACSSTVTSNCYAAICTAAMTNCYTYSPPCTASLTTNCNLPCSLTVTANCFAQPCSSSVTSYCYNTYPPCSATVTSNCNVPVNLSGGSGGFALPATENTPAIHYLTFTYSGDLPLCTNTSGTNCIPPVCSTTQTTNCVPPPCTGSNVPPSCIVGGPATLSGSDAFGDFVCSVAGGLATASCPTTQTAAFPLVVDFADFNITSTYVLIDVNPGVVPSGNGLPSAPGQSSSTLETGTLQLQSMVAYLSAGSSSGSVNTQGFNGGGSNSGVGIGPINVTCTSSHPSYISCFMTPTTSCLTTGTNQCLPAQASAGTNGASGVTTSTVVLAVSTPVSEPIGFNTSQVRTVATRTALAFLPFGVLAFCVRRRRRLSQVLWMLIAICAVSAGVIGCGGNNSTLYTPIPTGNQNVVVTISGTTPIAFTGTIANGSASVTSVSSTLGLAVGQTIAVTTGIPTGTTIASISGNTITLSANATAGATETLNATLAVSRSYSIPIYIF
jgi:sugar lactone lactonase YvrE